MSSNIGKKGICIMKKAKKVLALALSMLMIASMFVIAPMSASAETSRLDNWQGNITTVLNIKGGGDSTRSDVQEDGYYLTVSDSDLYVGDKIVANGQWLNYSLNYINDDGETVSGTPNGNGQWFCNGNWKFDSQLAYGKISSNTNDARTFDTAGTWTLYVPLDTGVSVVLIEFEVKRIPRINNWQGAENVTLSFSSWDKSTGDYLKVNSDEIYTGDKLSYSGAWLNQNFTYENADGETVTGKLANGYVNWYCNGAQVLNSQLYYGHINGTSDAPATLSAAGTWTAYGTMSDGTVVTLAEFVVNQKPRAITNLDGTVFYDGAIDVKVYQANGIPFSTEELYVGDKLVNGSSWWTNTGISVEIDGEAYTGRITWLTFTDPNGNIATGYQVWNGGSIDYVLKTAGTYTLSGKVENLKDAKGNDCGSKEPVILRTFTVKECPHNYELTTVAPTCTSKGYDLYTCAYCGDSYKENYVDALGQHKLSCANGVVTCANCDYTKEYTGEAVSFGYKVSDPTGAGSYTTLEPAYFVGDTISNATQWWKNFTFTYGETSGTVYNAWIVKGDLEYFNEYRAKRLADASYKDPNITYVQVGYNNVTSYTFDEAGTYTLVAALQYDETSTFLTNIIPFALAEMEVFDVSASGDINGDNEVTALDLLALQEHILNINALDTTTAADLNNDGKVDAADVAILQIKILGL